MTPLRILFLQQQKFSYAVTLTEGLAKQRGVKFNQSMFFYIAIEVTLEKRKFSM
jgi:hypothetical protein